MESDIMVNTDKLRGIIVEKGYTQEEIAKFIGICPKTFYRKMALKVFKTDEAEAMINKLEIENPTEVFFDVK